ncbi:MAG: hypothetical protein AAF921_25810 [Cyanobacteria bacterium P01_D01_bin.44]
MEPTPVTLSLSESTIEQHIRAQRFIAQEANAIHRELAQLQQTIETYKARLRRLEQHSAQVADHLQTVLEAKQAQQQPDTPPSLPPLLQRRIF